MKIIYNNDKSIEFKDFNPDTKKAKIELKPLLGGGFIMSVQSGSTSEFVEFYIEKAELKEIATIINNI